VPGEIKKYPVPLTDLERLAAEGKLFAVLDACGSPPIQAKIRCLVPETVLCLHRTKNEDLLKNAPYVAKVDRDLLSWLVTTVWTEPWGIFLAGTADLATLYRHLRKFLVIKDPEDEVVYFRYYDPRVLPTFLSACNDEELDEFFGPILAMGTSGDSSNNVVILRKNGNS
jgi:hypothetical protein